MKILVLVESYPKESDPYRLMYVHTRNLEYIKQNIIVDVLSFSDKESYQYEGVNVLTERDIYGKIEQYDKVISHAPNVRNHLRVLNKYDLFNKTIYFIHGHEALNVVSYYPGSYNGIGYSIFRKVYEHIKLKIFRYALIKKKGSKVIFVSQWMKDNAENCLNISFDDYVDNTIIYNSCSDYFLKNKWNEKSDKLYDFITIRPLSEKKYGADIVLKMARKYPEYNFLLYGKGDIFDYITKPDNVTHIPMFLKPVEIPEVLNKAKCALMPTRLDAQGVMMCEIASFGIPLYTSDIEVCREVLGEFENVKFIDNEEPELSDSKFSSISLKNKNKFDIKSLVQREIDFIKV